MCAARANVATSSPVHHFTFLQLLRWVGLIGILTIAAVRCAILFAPQVVFDTDPAFDATPLAGLGPAGSMMLDVILLVACAAAIFGEWLSGRAVNWIVLLLALIPLPIVLWHGSHDAGNLWLGSTWLAAAVACAALFHLARDRTMRIVIVSILLGATVPVLARGVVQVTHEHAQTVQYYEQNREQFLRQSGWEPGSPSAQIYERRLYDAQPTAWFATSNVFASLAGFSVVMWIGLTIAAIRHRLPSGWTGVTVPLALGAAVMLWVAGSKGALLAAVAAIMVLLFFAFLPGVKRFDKRARLIVVALMALALFGVFVRGAVLPEGFLNEKSLLFRWHYLVAAWRIFSESPLLGVGPDGFQAAYMLHRVPRNPEEVSSAHSMFIDWLCMLGISGAAWIALLLLLLISRGGGRAFEEEAHMPTPPRDDDNSDHSLPKTVTAPLLVALAAIVLGFVPALINEWHAVDDLGFRGRLLGIGGFAVTAVVAACILDRSTFSFSRLVLLAALAALLMHAQIEMTFVQPGAVVWAMCAIGALGHSDQISHDKRRPMFAHVVVWLMIAALVLAAAWIAIFGWGPAQRQQNAMIAAAKLVEPQQRNQINVTMADVRRRPVAALERAYELWPINVQPLNAAANQLLLAAATKDSAEPLALLLDAKTIAERAIDEHNKASSISLAVAISMRLGLLTGDAQHWDRAVELARELTRRDPHGIHAWRQLGAVLWSAGRHDEAAAAYRRALESDANFELDELKRLPEKERERFKQIVKEPKPS